MQWCCKLTELSGGTNQYEGFLVEMTPRTGDKASHQSAALRPVAEPEDVHAEELGHLGLTTYEARAYLALVRRESSTDSATWPAPGSADARLPVCKPN